MRTSLRQLVGIGAGGGVALIGGALYYRQKHLQNSPVVEGAVQQLLAAEAVRGLLGSPVASTTGVLGGYTDPVGGTACITLPVVSEGGVRAVARVEAEAEWLVMQAQAEARGEVQTEQPVKRETCRWLLRHLEIELETPSSSHGVSAPAVTVLYSLPANAPLLSWAPEREPSLWAPRWLSALFPNPQAALQAEVAPRLILTGFVAVFAHAIVFARLHKRMITEKMLQRAETLLTLPETPTHNVLANRAFDLAAQAVGPDGARQIVRHAGAPLYGHSDGTRVLAFTSLRKEKEFFFRAERQKVTSRSQSPHGRRSSQQLQRTRDGWLITAIGIAPTELYSKRLASLPLDASEMALLETMLSVESKPIDLGDLDCEVVIVAAP